MHSFNHILSIILLVTVVRAVPIPQEDLTVGGPDSTVNEINEINAELLGFVLPPFEALGPYADEQDNSAADSVVKPIVVERQNDGLSALTEPVVDSVAGPLHSGPRSTSDLLQDASETLMHTLDTLGGILGSSDATGPGAAAGTSFD